jgi:hypothetical protein
VRNLLTFLVFTIFFLTGQYCYAGDDAIVEHLHDGEIKDIYWGINVKGVVYLSVRSRAGPGCARMFWRPIPTFNRTITLNDVCGNIRAEIPGLSDWAVGGVLWARANQGDVAIIASSKERVAYDFPPVEFP